MPVQSSFQREAIELYFSKEYKNGTKPNSRDSFYMEAIEYLREVLVSRLASKGNVFLCQVDDCVVTAVRQGLGIRDANIDSIQVTAFTETINCPVEHDRGETCSHYSIWMWVVYDESYRETFDPKEISLVQPRNGTHLKYKQMGQLSDAVEVYLTGKLKGKGKVDDDDLDSECGTRVPHLHSFPHLTIVDVRAEDDVREMISEEYEKMKRDHDTPREDSDLESSRGWLDSIKSDCVTQSTEVDEQHW
ncbi:hypothetical protein N7509_013483 [Penicillium cosmopolitanum]|uniref:Uncharacterized protein n=1 Tax=Penicillium cosmopolitanum TaxID=1131564 RepID=A0A9W9SDE2_9EURO|nr:uncharacterized protein N7509_013483 [Penicillium cosmopolitanum]KAJ5376597.1 hypothetical protein N7509_013483 [Penicillium cosmopolitanum]